MADHIPKETPNKYCFRYILYLSFLLGLSGVCLKCYVHFIWIVTWPNMYIYQLTLIISKQCTDRLKSQTFYTVFVFKLRIQPIHFTLHLTKPIC